MIRVGFYNFLIYYSSTSSIKIMDYLRNDLKVKKRGLPWWRSGWESACQCRTHGFEPWSGKIPHATEQLGPWATITEPALRNKRGRDSERPAHRDEEWPRLPQLEKALAQKRRPNTAINKINKMKLKKKRKKKVKKKKNVRKKFKQH